MLYSYNSPSINVGVETGVLKRADRRKIEMADMKFLRLVSGHIFF
jgi:hypothetical protein